MPKRISPQLCSRCKGYKRLCGLPRCPILERFRVQVISTSSIRGSVVDGSTPPSLVVGERGYPRVPVLYAEPPGVRGSEAKLYDDPTSWWELRLPLNRIVELRASLVSGVKWADARKPMELYSAEFPLAALSSRPVDSEVELARKPLPRLRFDGLLAPEGPSAPARRIRVTSSPSLSRAMERVIWDDAPAAEAVWKLWRSGEDFYNIVRAFSLGFTGRLRSRRMVPTRWAITAVDSIITSKLLQELRGRDSISEVEVYHASYLGNYFTIILYPGAYRAEMIEIWYPWSIWTRGATKPVVQWVSEPHPGRLTDMDGGFMAARLSIVQHLHSRGRVASILIIREITRDYYAPVGNWHIRLTVAKALENKPVSRHSSVEEALRSILKLVKDARVVEEALRRTYTLRRTKQRRLDDYLAGVR